MSESHYKVHENNVCICYRWHKKITNHLYIVPHHVSASDMFCWTFRQILHFSKGPTSLRSYQCCWWLSSPVSSILEGARGGGGPAPGSRPGVRTPAGESDTRPAAAPRPGRRRGPRCSPVWRAITQMSQVLGRGRAEA